MVKVRGWGCKRTVESQLGNKRNSSKGSCDRWDSCDSCDCCDSWDSCDSCDSIATRRKQTKASQQKDFEHFPKTSFWLQLYNDLHLQIIQYFDKLFKNPYAGRILHNYKITESSFCWRNNPAFSPILLQKEIIFFIYKNMKYKGLYQMLVVMKIILSLY